MATNKRFIIDKDGDILDKCFDKKMISLNDIVRLLNGFDSYIRDFKLKTSEIMNENKSLLDKVKSASKLCSALADIINAYYDFLDKDFPNLIKEDMVNIVFKVIKSDIDWFLFCNDIKK